MANNIGYGTTDLALALLDVAIREAEVCSPAWAATFESSAVFMEIRRLVTAARAGGAKLFVCMTSEDGCGQAYSFGRADAPVAPTVPSEREYPFYGVPPAGDVVSIEIEGSGVASRIRVVTHTDGKPHGYLSGSPAHVEAASGMVGGAYYANVRLAALSWPDPR